MEERKRMYDVNEWKHVLNSIRIKIYRMNSWNGFVNQGLTPL